MAAPLRIVENEDPQGVAFWRGKYQHDISDDEAEETGRNVTGFAAVLARMRRKREEREANEAS
jgi:hypothetical protein